MNSLQSGPANRLVAETSPYLLQHAHNPVDWFPWGEEAFAESRRTGKPIFLSVGYSTCYWCHVMERQCFEKADVAAVMNERFINIKVDREERPDVDQLYMTAVQVMTRSGGWPMSVWLLPDGRPFYGGTYFPPEDAYGRPGFKTLLVGLSEAVKTQPDDIEATAGEMLGILSRLASPTPAEEDLTIAPESVPVWIERSTVGFDPINGGFGGAPKFPRETQLELLLDHLAHDEMPEIKRTEIAAMLRKTLDAMSEGGIRDQLGGGFHRYSTDAEWLVPHFEIMLYDNGMLGWIYTEAGRLLGEPRYHVVARELFDYVLRDLTAPSGLFYTAYDAEVDAHEGEPYLWTKAEVEGVLRTAGAGTADVAAFTKIYGLDDGPNFSDPHGADKMPRKNVLYIAKPTGLSPRHVLFDDTLRMLRGHLLAARKLKKQPRLDDKILTAWNALMIRGLAHAGAILNEPRYTAAARRAADGLLKIHRAPGGGLLRTSTDGVAKIAGFLDDYAFLAQALLALGDDYRAAAGELADQMRTRFADEKSQAYFFTDATASDLIVRQRVGSDSPLPAGAAVAIEVLLELGRIDEAKRLAVAFAQETNYHAEQMNSLVQATTKLLRKTGPITIPAAPAAARGPQTPHEQAEHAVKIGGRFEGDSRVVIELHIADGYHLNGNSAPAGLIATQLRVAASGERYGASVTMPPGVEKTFPFADEALPVYEGKVECVIDLAVPIEPGKPLPLVLVYQACTESACLAPVTKTFDVGASE